MRRRRPESRIRPAPLRATPPQPAFLTLASSSARFFHGGPSLCRSPWLERGAPRLPPPLPEPEPERGGRPRPEEDDAGGLGMGWAAYRRDPPAEAPKTTKDPHRWGPFARRTRRRPTLPGPLDPSTIGAGGLNFRVRNGNGCDPSAMATETCCQWSAADGRRGSLENSIASTNFIVDPSPRPISTGRLNTLLCVHLRPINVMVCHGPYLVDPVGNLILERASYLDAFSTYPFRRSLTSGALGRTTGTRELRPSRSSRTRDSLPQVSSGCSG